MKKNKIYINGTGIISAQKTFDNSLFLEEIISSETNQLKAFDPNYKEYVAGDMVRRMSHVIKMGIAASKICLEDAKCPVPDAIITGTGMGCMEDTEKFLGNMVANNEEFLTPTSFIQSTHNTVSAQIALLLKCHNYNFTYVHRGLSFESALVDTMVKLQGGQYSKILLGTSDEITKNSHVIMERMGFWRRKPFKSLELFNTTEKGTVAGEGAAFFLLSSEKTESSYASVSDLSTLIYPADKEEIINKITDILRDNDLTPDDIDLMITGENGDSASDMVYQQTIDSILPDAGKASFKHLSGEYHTSASFAFWMALKILKNQTIPSVAIRKQPVSGKFRNILIYNHYRNINHSFILVTQA